MNPNTQMAVSLLPSAASPPAPQRNSGAAEGPSEKGFSAALERQLGQRPSESVAASGPAAEAQAASVRPAEPVADAGKGLPQGGKTLPAEADAATTSSQAPTPVPASGAASEAVVENVRGPSAPVPAEPGLIEAATLPAVEGELQALAPAPPLEEPLEDLAAFDSALDTAAANQGSSAERDALFDYFSRNLDSQSASGAATFAAPLPTAAGAQTASADGQSDSAASASLHEETPALALWSGRSGEPATPWSDASAEAPSAGTPETSRLFDVAGSTTGDGDALPDPNPSSVPNSSSAAPASPPSLDGLAAMLNDSAPRPVSSGLASAAAVPAGVLMAAVGSEDWFDQLGAGLRWQIGEGVSEARLRLNPAELGSLEVQVRVTERGAEVHFMAPHAHAREALEQGMQRLRESLDAHGLQLADASVSDGRSGQGGREPASPVLPAWAGGPWRADDEVAEGEALLGARLQGRGLIDLYA